MGRVPVFAEEQRALARDFELVLCGGAALGHGGISVQEKCEQGDLQY